MCKLSLRLAGLTQKSCRTCSPVKVAQLPPGQCTAGLCEAAAAVQHQDKEMQGQHLQSIPGTFRAQFTASKQLRAGTRHSHRVSLQPRADLSCRQYQHLKVSEGKGGSQGTRGYWSFVKARIKWCPGSRNIYPHSYSTADCRNSLGEARAAPQPLQLRFAQSCSSMEVLLSPAVPQHPVLDSGHPKHNSQMSTSKSSTWSTERYPVPTLTWSLTTSLLTDKAKTQETPIQCHENPSVELQQMETPRASCS